VAPRAIPPASRDASAVRTSEPGLRPQAHRRVARARLPAGMRPRDHGACPNSRQPQNASAPMAAPPRWAALEMCVKPETCESRPRNWLTSQSARTVPMRASSRPRRATFRAAARAPRSCAERSPGRTQPDDATWTRQHGCGALGPSKGRRGGLPRCRSFRGARLRSRGAGRAVAWGPCRIARAPRRWRTGALGRSPWTEWSRLRPCRRSSRRSGRARRPRRP
jgi:hypothetical protein